MSAPAVYTFPDNATLTELERERRPVVAGNYLGEQFMPWEEEDADTVLWEIRDNIVGLQLVREANQPFPVIPDEGINRFLMTPGRYGEMKRLDEQKIERSRKIGEFGEAVDVGPEISRMQESLADRENSLIEACRWALMSAGVVNVLNKNGDLIRVAEFDITTYTPNVPWSTVATATPLNDFRLLRDNYAGFGHNFGYGAVAIGNPVTLNTIWRNTNQNDIAGKRTQGLGSVLSITEWNELMAKEDLPTLISYNRGYLSNLTTFARFIPTGKVVVIGYNDNQGTKCGSYTSTRVGAALGKTGVYAEAGLASEPPRLPWTARGHNGAPKIDYSRQVVVIDAYTP